MSAIQAEQIYQDNIDEAVDVLKYKLEFIGIIALAASIQEAKDYMIY